MTKSFIKRVPGESEEGEGEAGLDAQARAILRAFRAAEELPPPVSARVWARVAASTAEETRGSAGPVRSRRAEWGWAAVAVCAAAAVLLAARAGLLGPVDETNSGAAAVYGEGQRAGPTLTEPRPLRAEEAASAAGEDELVEDAVVIDNGGINNNNGGDPVTPAKPAGEGRGRGRGDRAAPAPVSTLAQEAELLGRAQAAIQGGRAEEALGLLQGHAQRFPAGMLGEEREALEALALCAAGRVTEGRGAAKAFLKGHAGSALAERVRKGCLEE